MNSIGNNVNATDTGMREFTPEEYKAEAANTGMREFTPEEYKADAANTGMEEIREDSSNAKEDP
jgi:arginase family enzyme